MSKKSGGSAPPPPDPRVVSQAQSEANIASAREQQRLNMIGTTGPSGTVNYVADETQPGGYRQVTALSQPEQAIYDAQKATELGATNIAHDQLGRVQTALQTPLSTDGLPDLRGGVGPYGVMRGFNTGQSVQGDFNQGPGVQTSFSAGGGIQMDPGLRSSFNTGPQLQFGFDQGQGVQGQVGGDQDIARLLASGANYQQYASRLDPQFDRAEDRERTRLANMGFSQNSAGYKDALDDFGRTKNDAYNQAILSSIREGEAAAQGQFGRQLAQGEFANEAAGQQFGQGMGAAQFYNATAGQEYGQNRGEAEFFNGAMLSQMDARNRAQAQGFGQNQAQAQFGNQAASQIYGQNLGAMQARNQAAGQQYQQGMGEAQFYNQAQNQSFNQNTADAQLSNTARQQGLNERAYIQNTPINQLTGLLSLGQVGAPQGVQYTPSQVANTDVLGAYALQTQAQQAQAQMRAQQQSGLMSGLMSLGSAAIMASDRRLKADTRRLGARRDGLPVWSFRYLDDPEGVVRIGYMADEVKRVRPDLVVRRADGFLAVNYLGLDAEAA